MAYGPGGVPIGGGAVGPGGLIARPMNAAPRPLAVRPVLLSGALIPHPVTRYPFRLAKYIGFSAVPHGTQIRRLRSGHVIQGSASRPIR